MLELLHNRFEISPTRMAVAGYADNVPAVTVYERLGFGLYEVDLMYRTEM